ncbi:MAG: Phosphoribosylaminoimidazole-succinocarboxamide synthase [Planctomycetes bacterium ADurb.Bin126]|nr:MAG: Phosphoribosylaminoimidazole-succinocarboxamide synthase [Planctomycetes bacterium ADurb.Bin126]HOD84057.1 phosphoribosylaminoimidazolesuccinocarboxamide synthase [Phycisphaerae bacterium]HQL76415.1 phosphoribosylaminoimidazolesuccinocarboxamide synthase [Phycisphaerae bacterium]
MKTTALLTTSVPNHAKRSGKVRDIYDLPQGLLIVATDRISAYDVVMPNGIPDKGRVLTQISLFWFDLLKDITPNHLLSADLDDLPVEFRTEEIDGRFMLCKRARVVPIECIVRGYLAGSGWKEYQKSGSVCGLALPEGLKQCSQLPEPIFTPTTKAEAGHDENITFDDACQAVGAEIMTQLRDKSLTVYAKARDYAAERGIIVADTKFEWGLDDQGEVILIDEVLTPDSSRFWPADSYKPGRDQPSFDKQFVRDYLDRIQFDRTPPAPLLPAEIVQKTRAKYIEAYTRLTGQTFLWD